MANRARALSDNTPGNFFVDDTCIDCDTCRQIAPLTFTAVNNHSVVHQQPTTQEALATAARAIISCPTASIGCNQPELVLAAQNDLPQVLTQYVWYCGWTSRHSFGASSYLVRQKNYLWMVDAPRWSPSLVKKIEQLGGLNAIFLTHRDDIADAKRYAAHFGAQRIIHQRDADAMPDAERIISGDELVKLSPELTCIPVPGHTAGSMALLTKQGALFSGDHVWWSPRRQTLNASKGVCWHDWDQQIASMKRLQQHVITQLFPGHGRRYEAPAQHMHDELETLITRMQSDDPDAWP